MPRLAGSIWYSADFKGRYVRLNEQQEVGGASPFPTQDMTWRTLAAWKWQHEQHINVLESNVVFQCIRYRSRDPSRHLSRVVLGVDNTAAIGAGAKGRSSSSRLNRILKRQGALLLASGQYPGYIYVPSADNPADGPSRPSLRDSKEFFRLLTVEPGKRLAFH